MNKWILFFLLLNGSISSMAIQPWHGRIMHVNTQTNITFEKLITTLSNADIIILGENHNTQEIQQAESVIINHVVKAQHKEKNFITAWEFLNYTDQEIITHAYHRFVNGEIGAETFLQITQGSTHNISYIPILETTKLLQGHIIGVNISRAAKEPVLTGGIDALDPKYLPPKFAMGTANYRQRFIDIMKDHIPANRIENYYAAQCLTDDIMAYTLQQNDLYPLIFLITGNFHTDYYDGVANRIHLRQAKMPIVVRFIDASDYQEHELNESLPEILHHDAFGDIADYIYFVNEPMIHQKQVTLSSMKQY